MKIISVNYTLINFFFKKNLKIINFLMSQSNNKPSIFSKNLILSHKSKNYHRNKNNLIINTNNENSKSPLFERENILNQILFRNKINEISSMIDLERRIFKQFKMNYMNKKNFYNIKAINEIIRNDNTHIVAKYKDYLIEGDNYEFLQKRYLQSEINECLPTILEYYENFSVIFPNYVILPESKYIYKNIKKKQKLINIQQDLEEKQKKIKNGKNYTKGNENPIFTTHAIDSILEQTDTSGIKEFFGLKNNDSSKNLSLENIINKISKAENYYITRKTNYALKKIKLTEKFKNGVNFNLYNSNYKIKGRNYKRYLEGGFNGSSGNNNLKKGNNYPGLNINSTTSNGMKNTKVSSTTMDMDSKNNNNIIQGNNSNTIYISSYTRNNNNKNNTINSNSSIKKQNLVTNVYINNKELVDKVLKGIKKIENKNSKKKSMNFSPFEKSYSKTRISTSIHYKQLSTSSSNNGKIFSYHKKNIPKQINHHKKILSYNSSCRNKKINESNTKNKKGKDNPSLLTERDTLSKKHINPDIIKIFNSNLNKNNSCKKNSISSISSKKKKNNILHSRNNIKVKEMKNVTSHQNIRKKKKNLDTENSILLINNNSKNRLDVQKMKSGNSQCFSLSPNKYLDYNKILKTFINFNSKNFLVNNGKKNINNNISNNNNVSKKKINKKDEKNISHKDINNIKIKNFKEVIQNSNLHSQEVYNSERIFFDKTLNKNNNRTNRGSNDSKTCFEIFSTLTKNI